MDWLTISRLYAELARLEPTPAVTLNRAVAVAEVEGPAAGLAMIDSLLGTPAGAALARASSAPHVARGDLLRPPRSARRPPPRPSDEPGSWPPPSPSATSSARRGCEQLAQ